MLYGGGPNQPPPRQIRREMAEAILSVTPEDDRNPLVPVDSTGARRRLEALAARRWSPRTVAAEAQAAGVQLSPTTLRAIMRGEQITGNTDGAVRTMYQMLWDKTPPETTRQEHIAANSAARRARDGGWAPPAAWGEAQLDAPDGQPDPGWQPSSRRRTAQPTWLRTRSGSWRRRAAVWPGRPSGSGSATTLSATR